MFTIPIDTVIKILIYLQITFAASFCIGILTRRIKIALYSWFTAFWMGLFFSLFAGTGSIACTCTRQPDQIVACERTRHAFYGVFRQEYVIKPVDGAITKSFEDRTEAHLTSQGETYLLYNSNNDGLYNPFQYGTYGNIDVLFPHGRATRMVDEVNALVAGEGESVKEYRTGGGFFTNLVNTIFIVIIAFVGKLLVHFILKPFADLPW